MYLQGDGLHALRIKLFCSSLYMTLTDLEQTLNQWRF